MKKILTLCMAALMAVSVWANGLLAPKVVIYKDMSKYKFVYIIPTSSVTSASGTHGYVSGSAYGNYGSLYGSVHSGATKTTNPADEICGQLVKRGYTILPSIDPALAAKTMVVAYGNAGRRSVSLHSYASAVVLQFTDAETHEILATFETEGCGSNETEDIREAIDRAFDVYDDGIWPYIKIKIEEASRSSIVLRMFNRMPNDLKSYTLRIRYYNKNNEVVHEQYYTANTPIRPGESERMIIKRDKEARISNTPISVTIERYD